MGCLKLVPKVVAHVDYVLSERGYIRSKNISEEINFYCNVYYAECIVRIILEEIMFISTRMGFSIFLEFSAQFVHGANAK